HLPCSINIILAPAAIPRAIVILSVDQIFHAVPNALRVSIESDVPKQFQCARSEIATSWIEDCVVIRKRHVLQPLGRYVFIKRSPAAIITLETELPPKRSTKEFIERLPVLRLN